MRANAKTLLAHLCVFVAGASVTAAAIILTYAAGGGDFSPGKELGFIVSIVFFFAPGFGMLGNCALSYFLVGNEFKDDEVDPRECTTEGRGIPADATESKRLYDQMAAAVRKAEGGEG